MKSLPDEFSGPLEALLKRRRDVRLQIEWHDEVSSTMDLAGQAALDGAAAGLVILADRQTAGRGRQGHHWASPAGAGLYFSLIVRPTGGAALTTIAAGAGVRGGILQATGLAADLKWPNDLLVGRRKLAGILAEAHGLGAVPSAIVVGVGINVRTAPLPPDVEPRATSLESELGVPADRGIVLAAVLERLTERLASLDRGDAGDILQAWRAAAPSAAGSRVEWDTLAGPRTGITDGIDDDGALRVLTASGMERIVSGEVRWLQAGSQ